MAGQVPASSNAGMCARPNIHDQSAEVNSVWRPSRTLRISQQLDFCLNPRHMCWTQRCLGVDGEPYPRVQISRPESTADPALMFRSTSISPFFEPEAGGPLQAIPKGSYSKSRFKRFVFSPQPHPHRMVCEADPPKLFWIYLISILITKSSSLRTCVTGSTSR